MKTWNQMRKTEQASWIVLAALPVCGLVLFSLFGWGAL